MCRILVMGYDKRSQHLCNLLVNSGSKFRVDFLEPDFCNLKKISSIDYDTIILPIPTKIYGNNVLMGYNIKIENILNNWEDAKFVYATINKNDAFDKVKGISLLEDEAFVLKNAYLTAKAAIKIALGKMNLDGKVCMVAGNGRIGKCLCSMLKEQDTDIILVSKNFSKYQVDVQYKDCIGYKDIPDYLMSCDIVFNTAPYNYFSYNDLEKFKGIYMELASKPYGFAYVNKAMPQSVAMCPSLPGKYYPEEAAKIIYESIYDFVAKG